MSKIAFVTAPNDIDHNNVSELQRSLDGSLYDKPHGVVLDLSQTQYIDSSGLGRIIHNHRTMLDAGVRLVLVLCPESNIMSLIHRTGLAEILSIENSVESAIEVLSLA